MKFLINRKRFVTAVDEMEPWKRQGIEEWLEANPSEPIRTVCQMFNVSSWLVAEIVWRNNREAKDAS